MSSQSKALMPRLGVKLLFGHDQPVQRKGLVTKNDIGKLEKFNPFVRVNASR